jgi:opacity protein-like surface antigen
MKKKFIAAALLSAGIVFANSAAKAQGAYVKLGAGYNFGIGSNGTGDDYNISQSGSGSNTTFTYEQVKVNYGKGVNAGIGLGYMFNEHVGAELGIDYLIGGKSELEDNAGTTTGTTEKYSRMLLLKPALVISAGMEGVNPYARFGIVAAKGKVHENITQSSGPDKLEREVEYAGGWGVGLQGGLGVEFNLSDNMAFYSELTMSNLSYSPDRGEVTKFTFNGADELSDFTTNEREVEFTDEYTEKGSGTPDSEPTKALKMSLPFSSVGIGVGLKFKF